MIEVKQGLMQFLIVKLIIKEFFGDIELGLSEYNLIVYSHATEHAYDQDKIL